MRIGLFTDAYLPEITGVTVLVRRLRDELKRLGHEVLVYAPRYDRPSDDERDVFRFRAGPVFAYKTARMAVPYSREATRTYASLDLVHSHTPFSLAYAAFTASFRHRIPHVQTYHTYLSQYRHYVPRPIRPTVKGAERYSALLCNRCTVVTVPTPSIREELRRFGVHRPIFDLPFGPDLTLYERPPVWSPRAALGIPEDSNVFLYAGRVAPEKNLRFVLRAFEKIHREDPTSVLVFAGDGPLLSSLGDEGAAAGLTDSIRFPGFLDQERLVDMYRESSVFLFASKTETQGLVLVEAMAAGTPAVAVDALGVRDVVCDGENGFLVPEDTGTFAHCALELASSPSLLAQLGAGARATAEEVSVQASTARLIGIYEACLRLPVKSRLRRRSVRQQRLRRS